MKHGELFVMTFGTILMLKLSVDSWDIALQVSSSDNFVFFLSHEVSVYTGIT
jgi:hypothetical protein